MATESLDDLYQMAAEQRWFLELLEDVELAVLGLQAFLERRGAGCGPAHRASPEAFGSMLNIS